MYRTRPRLLLAFAAAVLLTVSGCATLDRLKARDALNEGVKAYRAQDFEAAAEHFEEAVQLDSSLTDAYLYLAAAYRSQWIPHSTSAQQRQIFAKSVRTFEKVLEQDPGNINAIASIAGLYANNDQPDEAKLWYEKRIEVEPGNPEPYYGIGTLNWQRAHDVTGLNGEAAVDLEDEDRLRVQQLVDEGVESLQKALELNPEYSDAMQYLNLLFRERAYLAVEEEEKERWQKEADRLALRALQLKRQQQEEEEKARRTFGKSETG